MSDVRAVVVFQGRNEFEAQMARDILTAAGIPTLHLPTLSTGVFGVATTTHVAVPEDRVEKALEALREGGMEGEAKEPAKGFAEFREAVNERLPLPLLGRESGTRLTRVLIGLSLAILAIAILLVLTRS